MRKRAAVIMLTENKEDSMEAQLRIGRCICKAPTVPEQEDGSVYSETNDAVDGMGLDIDGPRRVLWGRPGPMGRAPPCAGPPPGLRARPARVINETDSRSANSGLPVPSP